MIEVTGLGGNMVTDEGDSGSVLVGQHKGKTVVIGLNFAMSSDRRQSYAIPFGRAISELKLSIPASRLIDIKS